MTLGRLRTPALFLLAVLIEAAMVAMLRLGDLSRHAIPLLAWALSAALFYLIAVWIVLAAGSRLRSSAWWLIVGAALLFRLTLLPLPPSLSHSFYRHHWEGKIQSYSPPFNPYFFAPENPIFVPMRGPDYGRLKHKQLAAAAPPLAELVARWNYRWFPRPWEEKLIPIGFDLLTILALAGWLRRRGLPRERALIYAWSPLAVIEAGANGHFIAIFMCLLVASFYLAGEWDRLSHLAMGLAAMLGLPALALLPAWLRQQRRRRWLWLLAPVIVCSLPYLFFNKHFFLPAWGRNLSASLRLWLAGYANGGISLLPRLLGAGLTLPVRIAALAAFAALLSWISAHKLEPARMAKLIAASALLLLPRLLPVYVLWLLPWLALDPDPAWLCFSSIVVLAYPPLISTAYRQTNWQLWEFLPLYGLLLWGWLRNRRRDGAVNNRERSVSA